ncbi:MAG: ABC transporter permease [Caldilineales bacterium]|nr:ABC transporter permease [Caldilineales bacterium]
MEASSTTKSARSKNGSLSRLLSNSGQTLSLALVLIALFIFFSLTTDAFMTQPNLINIMRQVSFTGITAVGAAMVLLIGGIDLSIGSVLAFTGVIAAKAIIEAGLPPLVGIFAGIGAGMFVGLINGLIITRLHIPALITTLGTLTIVRGVSFTLTSGLPVFGFPKEPFLGFQEGVQAVGKGYIGPIPVPVVLMIIIFILGFIFLYRTYFGRYIYAIGGNAETSRLSGIKVERMQLLVYTLAGLLTGVAGMIVMGRVNSGQPSIGVGFELEVITAVVLGGVSIAGGSGSLVGVILGVFIMGVLSNGLIILNVSEYNQMVVRGLVLLIAVGIDQLRIRARRT